MSYTQCTYEKIKNAVRFTIFNMMYATKYRFLSIFNYCSDINANEFMYAGAYNAQIAAEIIFLRKIRR